MFLFLKCMYIFKTILCIVSPLHQITKKLVYASVRVFLMHPLWEGWSIWYRFLFWRYAFRSICFPFLKVLKTLLGSFSFAIWASGNAKTYIFVVLFHDDFCCWETWKCEKGLSLRSRFTTSSLHFSLNWSETLLRLPSKFAAKVFQYILTYHKVLFRNKTINTQY